MKKSALFLSLLSGVFMFSQTKLIAYKSHSGNLKNFETAVSEDKFDTNFSNLGLPSIIIKVDSVIILNNDKAVVISRSGRLDDKERDTFALKTSKKNNKNFISDSDIAQLNMELGRRKYGFFNLKDSSVIYLKYNQQKKTYEKLKKEKPKPQIKTSEIKKASLVSNLLVVSVFGLSIAAGLFSRKKIRNEK